MPPQIKRLLPLFFIFIVLFLLIRYFLVPDSFGQYGHYRGNSLEEIASTKMVYADGNKCAECHQDVVEIIEYDVHGELSCLTCHGPGLAHEVDPQATGITKESGREFCGRCHDIHPARPENIVFQVDIRTHHTEIKNCIDCHHPHNVWEGLE